MGNRNSSSSEKPTDHPVHVGYYRQLYQELNTQEHAGDAADSKTFRSRFENYFGGPYLELGHLLYHKLFGSTPSIDEEMFVSSMTVLERLSTNRGEHHEAESFYFRVFSEGKETIDRQGLTKILHVAATFAMVVGSDLHEKAVIPKDHVVLTSFANAAMLLADKTTGELHTVQFNVWVSEHCPQLLEGIRHWILSLLREHPRHQTGETNQPVAMATTDPPSAMSYQLPSISLEGEEQFTQELELTITIWALSTVLPLPFLGHKLDEKRPHQDYPIGGSWTLLYSSDKHGFSMNRFQHHCSDYREPSIMLLSCYHSDEDQQYTFAIAVDTEWRDGTYYWGGEKFSLVQLQPSFGLLISGPKLVSLNEKQRGFPTGLRVTTSDKHDSCILEVDPSLEKASFRNEVMLVRKVEVWGCGGVEAMESQQRVKKWEEREILRRRKVKTSDLKETWEDSPDRLLLEMGGVTTKRPTEQQQE